MTKTKGWVGPGPAHEFWMEENTPPGDFWCYVFDAAEPPMNKELHGLLRILTLLDIVQYGTIYETIDCIRIKRR